MSILSAASKLADIDAEKARLMAQVRQLNSMHNAAVPIGHLPPELLLEIFELHSIASLGDLALAKHNEFPTEVRTLRTIFAITHTCSLWRAAAVRCTGFWSTINVNFSPDVVDWLVRQGDPLPLHIFLGSTAPDVTPILFANISRIQAIGSIHCLMPGIGRAIPSLLEAIRYTTQGFKTFTRHGGMFGPEAAQLLFDTSASTLRVLCLDDTDLPWIRMPAFTNLHTISLASVPLGEGTYVQTVLKHLVDHCPRLCALFIGHLAVSPPPSEAKIYFPLLQFFGSELSLRPMESLINSLELPLDCRISLSIVKPETPMDLSSWSVHLKEILQLLGCVYSGCGLAHSMSSGPSPDEKGPTFTYPSIYLDIDHNEILFAAYDTAHCPPYPAYDPYPMRSPSAFIHKRPCVSIDVGCSFLDDEDFDDGITGSLTACILLPLISLAGVEILSIGYSEKLPGFFDEQAFTRFLMRCTSVHHLRIYNEWNGHVSNETLSTVIAALTSWIEVTDSLAAPQLHTLELERRVRNIRNDYVHTALKGLKGLMAWRRASGVPLEHLWLLDEDYQRLDLVLCEDQLPTR